MPQLSVIIPVYNTENYLRECLDSIINQTFKDIEIICVNDGSTDGSLTILEEYAQKDNRIVVLHKPNGGLSDARNAGLDIMRGNYVSFIDSDDYITCDMIETLLKSAKYNSCEIAVCNMIRFSEKGNTSPFYCPTNKEKVLRGNNRFETLKQPSVCNKLFEAKLLKSIRFPKGKYYSFLPLPLLYFVLLPKHQVRYY